MVKIFQVLILYLLKQRGFWNGFVDEGIRSSEVFDKKDVKDDACDADGVCHPPRNTDGPKY